jgi:hypothetical protein
LADFIKRNPLLLEFYSNHYFPEATENLSQSKVGVRESFLPERFPHRPRPKEAMAVFSVDA